MIKSNALDLIKGRKLPRVSYNTGTMLDVANGRFLPSGDGKSILDGGVASITSFFGKPQTYKSTLLIGIISRILAGYPDAEAIVWENENSIQDEQRFDDLSGGGIIRDRVGFLGIGECPFLEDFDDIITPIILDRIKNRDKYMMQTPFLDVHGKPIIQMKPLLIGIDSFSAANTRKVFKEFGAKTLDDNKNARAFMVEGGVKTQFFMKLPKIVHDAGITFFSSGHLKKAAGMGGPQEMFETADTPNMSKDDAVNRVGSQYLFLSNNAIESKRVKHLLKDAKSPIYGVDGLDRSDLLKVRCKLIKGKSQQGSGFEIDHICSNKYGIDTTVESFDYMRENFASVFGVGGNKTDPLTGTKFTNNSLRPKSESDPCLTRAIQVIGHYAYLRNIWVDYRVKLPSVLEFTDALVNSNQTVKDRIVNSTGTWEFTDASVKTGKELLSVLDVVNVLAADGALKMDKK